MNKNESSPIGERTINGLKQDKMEPPVCSCALFTFTGTFFMADSFKKAGSKSTISGYSPKDDLLMTEKYKLVFWAGDYGLAVSSNDMVLLTKQGKVELKTIPEVCSALTIYAGTKL